jgi:hypothetical protein
MFGFSSGKDAATVTRKRRYMAEAQQRWHFLTHFDASTMQVSQQLVSGAKA